MFSIVNIGCISIGSRCNIWNFLKKINVAKNNSITPNKFACKAISVRFPRVNLF